jgi:hypothetical protein
VLSVAAVGSLVVDALVGLGGVPVTVETVSTVGFGGVVGSGGAVGSPLVVGDGCEEFESVTGSLVVLAEPVEVSSAVGSLGPQAASASARAVWWSFMGVVTGTAWGRRRCRGRPARAGRR